MADLKISQLDAITTLTPATDVLPVVDSGGVTKKITTNQILGAGGTATLASATITGAATVGTTLGVTGVSTLTGAVGVGGSPASTYKFQSTQTSTSYGGWYLAGLFTSPTATMVRLSCSTPNLVSSIANDGDGGFKILTNGTLTTAGN